MNGAYEEDALACILNAGCAKKAVGNRIALNRGRFDLYKSNLPLNHLS